MTAILSNKILAIALVAAAFASSAFGCASNMGSDGGASQMSAGLNEARNGLAKTQTGIDGYLAGTKQSGMGSISDGMNLMDQGLADVAQGMGMMSGSMMMNCADGGSDTIVAPMRQARDEMHQGEVMLGSDAAVSDDEAIAHLQKGMTMMKTALDQADTSMRCMHHGSMM